MGDFDVSVGEGAQDKIVARFGLGERNDKGKFCVYFCREHCFKIKSTYGTQAKKDLHG